MKSKSLLHVIGWSLVLSSAILSNAHAQGLINFNNRIAGVVVAPVYGPEPGNTTVAIFGNTPSGTPAGTNTYGGALLAGTSYTAELWGGPLGTPEANLSRAATTVFRTSTLAGFVVAPASPVAIPGVPPGGMAVLQLRVWDNQGSNVLSWAAAQANPIQVASGASQIFVSPPLGDGGISQPPNLTGLRSFNIHLAAPSRLKIGRSTIAGGGGRSSGGRFSFNGTIGQFDAGALKGGSFSMPGGFWSMVAAVQTSGAPHLAVVRNPITGAVTISWPLPATAFVLDRTTGLSTTPAATLWTQVSFPYQTNATHIYLNVPAPLGKTFYRLRKP